MEGHHGAYEQQTEPFTEHVAFGTCSEIRVRCMAMGNTSSIVKSSRPTWKRYLPAASCPWIWAAMKWVSETPASIIRALWYRRPIHIKLNRYHRKDMRMTLSRLNRSLYYLLKQAPWRTNRFQKPHSPFSLNLLLLHFISLNAVKKRSQKSLILLMKILHIKPASFVDGSPKRGGRNEFMRSAKFVNGTERVYVAQAVEWTERCARQKSNSARSEEYRGMVRALRGLLIIELYFNFVSRSPLFHRQ